MTASSKVKEVIACGRQRTSVAVHTYMQSAWRMRREGREFLDPVEYNLHYWIRLLRNAS